MRNKLTRWGLSVLTMASVATAVVFATGWQSAIAASVTRVLVTNGPGRPVPVNGTITISGTPSVSVGNLPTDGSGSLKVAETGTPTVHVNNTDANGNLKVHEQGTANVNVQNFPASQTVNGSVSVSNLPAAPASVVIDQNENALSPGQFLAVADDVVSAYRDLTFYLSAHGPAFAGPGPGPNCIFYVASDPFSPHVFTLDSISIGTLPGSGNSVSAHISFPDLVLPYLHVTCNDGSSSDTNTIDWMLVGRTG